nr:MAG TPA: hypothetical protein [Bacteriophage sp.]
MSIAKRNTEKVFLRGHYEKVSLSCVVQIHTYLLILKTIVKTLYASVCWPE